MWRIAFAKQTATRLSSCTRLPRFTARYKHQMPIEPVEAVEAVEAEKLDTLLESYLLPVMPEKLTALPLIELGDYVEVFR